MDRLDEIKHMYWDKFITDLKALCEKHHVMLEGNEDGEVIVTDIHNAYETLNLGCNVSTQQLDKMLRTQVQR